MPLREALAKDFPLLEFFFQMLAGQVICCGLLVLVPDRYSTYLLLALILLILLLFARGLNGLKLGLLVVWLAVPVEADPVYRGDVTVSIRVAGNPRYDKESLVEFPVEVAGSLPGNRYLCRAIYLPWRNSVHWENGAIGTVRATFYPLTPGLSPFSYEARLRRRGVVGTCRIHFAEVKYGPPSSIVKFRNSIRKSVKEAGKNHEGNALLLSILLGVREGAGKPLDFAFKSLGLSHLLVVSGFHVTFIFGILYTIFKRILLSVPLLRPRYNCGQLSLLLVFPVCIGYVLLTGVTEPSLRALIALGVALVAQFVSCRYGTLHVLSIAMIIIHLCWPAALCEVGVQFTISALLGMRAAIYGREESLIRQYLRVAFNAGIFTGFVQLLWFDSLSLSGFLANPLLVPLILFLVAKLGSISLVLLYLKLPFAPEIHECLLSLLDLVCQLLRLLGSFDHGYIQYAHPLWLYGCGAIMLLECIRCMRVWINSRL